MIYRSPQALAHIRRLRGLRLAGLGAVLPDGTEYRSTSSGGVQTLTSEGNFGDSYTSLDAANAAHGASSAPPPSVAPSAPSPEPIQGTPQNLQIVNGQYYATNPVSGHLEPLVNGSNESSIVPEIFFASNAPAGSIPHIYSNNDTWIDKVAPGIITALAVTGLTAGVGEAFGVGFGAAGGASAPVAPITTGTAEVTSAFADFGSAYETGAATSAAQNVALAEATGTLPSGTLASQIGSESAAAMLDSANETAGLLDTSGFGGDFSAEAFGGPQPDMTGFGGDFSAEAFGGPQPDMTGFDGDFDATAMGAEGNAGAGPASTGAGAGGSSLFSSGGAGADAVGSAGAGSGGSVFSEGLPSLSMDKLQELVKKLPAYLQKKPVQQPQQLAPGATVPGFIEDNAAPLLGVAVAVAIGLAFASRKRRRR